MNLAQHLNRLEFVLQALGKQRIFDLTNQMYILERELMWKIKKRKKHFQQSENE